MESTRSLVKVAIPHSLGAYVPRKAMYFSFDSRNLCFVNTSYVTLATFSATRIWLCLETPLLINAYSPLKILLLIDVVAS